MKNQLLQLIRTLKQADSPMTSSSLANHLNVSPRSVKSYIQEINQTLPDTILSSQKGYTIVPLRIYFKGSLVKVEIGLCRGKNLYDKREALQKKDEQRNIERAFAGRE